MISEATAYGTGNIVSMKDRGAAFTINIPVKVTATLKEKKKIQGKISPELKKLAKKTLNFFSHPEYGVKIKVENKISSGLGGEEAESLALIFAVSGALAKAHGSVNELRIDKYWKEQFLVIDEKAIDKKKLLELCPKKLNFAKLAASFYGGFSVTDNEKREILRRGEMEHFFLVLKKIKKIKEEKVFQSELNSIWKEALQGNLYQAMKLNSLLHNPKETKKMFREGALTTFSPPYLLGLFQDKKERSTTTNQGVKILQKPKRIYRVNNFLKLKGAKEIDWC